MTEIQREPCPQCGEPAALTARVCPHCRGNMLFDIFADQRVVDPRQRYAVAKAIVALGLPGTTIASVQSALGLPGMPLARGLTRASAREALRLLEQQGVRGRETHTAEAVPPQPPAQTTPSPVPWDRRLRTLGLLGVALAAGATAVFLWLPVIRQAISLGAPAATQGSTPASIAPEEGAGVLTTREVADLAMPSTVSLRCGDSVGAGFFVAEELVLTNAHVVCAGNQFLDAQFRDGRKLAAQVVAKDDWLDLAVLRVLGGAVSPLPLGDATELGTGDKVIMIGSPRGLDFTVHEGIVSNAERNHFGVAYVQVDVNINPGNSGGPLLDTKGHVVGVVSMMVEESSGLGLVLPVNYAYAGVEAMVPAPEVGNPERWNALLAKVAEADGKEVAKVAQAFKHRPGGLVAATWNQRGNVVAVIALRWRTTPPERSSGTFFVTQNGRQVCGRTYMVKGWRRVDEESGSQKDSRFLTWMRKNGLSDQLYLGFAELVWFRTDCSGIDWSQPAELRLRDADPAADHIRLDQP